MGDVGGMMRRGFVGAVMSVATVVAVVLSCGLGAVTAQADPVMDFADYTPEQAAEQLNGGALAYYKYVGSTEAYKTLLGTDGLTEYTGYVDRNDPDDATSIDNMIAGARLVADVNDARADAGEEAVNVSDTYMAMAMQEADYAAVAGTTTNQYPVGKLLAFDESSPVYSWTLDADANAKLTHPYYTFSGIAVTRKGSHASTTVLTLGSLNGTGLGTSRAMSPEYYLNDLNAYRSALVDRLGPAPDLTGIKALIVKAQGLNENDWTSASWANLVSAVNKANDMLKHTYLASSTVSNRENALQSAIDGLQPANVDRSGLSSVIAQAESLNETDYTADSWGTMSAALFDARNVDADDKATQSDVDAAASALSSAIGALVAKPSRPSQPSTPSSGSFTDVSKSTPHADDISWLASSGISTGWKRADGRREFRPALSVTRQDMAAFLYRLAGSPKFDESKARNPFVDVSKSTPHYKEILWLASTGVSTGWKTARGTEFRGMSTVVRQDMAAFLHRLADYRKAKPTLGKAVSFKDVNAKTPHSADIAWLARTGVTTGWKDGTFRGMNPVVRQDMAAFLHRMNANVIK